MTVNANLYTMVRMKFYIALFVAIMFFANSLAVSAWAKPCDNMGEMKPAVQKIQSGPEMPCHESKEQPAKEQNSKSPLKHCHGICLCLHAALNQTPVLNTLEAFKVPIGKAERMSIHHENASSLPQLPPLRPPKTLS